MAEPFSEQKRHDRAYELIKSRIYAGDYAPDTPLVELQLGEDLHLSRTPIRNALQKLVYERLAVRDNTGHTFVAKLTAKDVHDITQMRKILEPTAIRSIESDPVDPETTNRILSRLHGILKEQKALALVSPGEPQTESPDRQNALIRYAELDHAFHSTTAALQNNHFLTETISTVNQTMIRYNILSGTLGQHTNAALSEHTLILMYLEKKDYELASIAMRRHVDYVSELIFDESEQAESSSTDTHKK